MKSTFFQCFIYIILLLVFIALSPLIPENNWVGKFFIGLIGAIISVMASIIASIIVNPSDSQDSTNDSNKGGDKNTFNIKIDNRDAKYKTIIGGHNAFSQLINKSFNKISNKNNNSIQVMVYLGLLIFAFIIIFNA